jgi:two-component system, OmpR family, sensor histidine kinase ChvG
MRRLLRWLIDELFRIRTRLLLVNVLIVAVPMLGISFARFYEREMLRSLETDMINQAEVLRQVLAEDPRGVNHEGLGGVLAESAKETRTRIRVLGPKGQLWADSHEKGPPEGPEKPAPSLLPTRSQDRWVATDPPEPTDVSGRSEVRTALGGKYGATTRFWENRDRLYLFSAMPILREGKVAGVVYVTRSTNPVRAAMYRLRTSLFTVLAVALALTAVLSVFLASTISRPLTHLTRVANRIAKGDRSQRLKLARRDEIGQLARAFDTMTHKLDERARYIGQLAANISHEFKSPLTSIRGAAELLEDGAADDPDARSRFLGNILVDANRLDRLVTRLLELARFEADPIPSEMIDFEALVRETAERAPAAAPVVVKYHAKRTQLLGRRAHLASALGNLIDNAQQHAEEDSQIEVRVTDGPANSIRTSVHNRGPAISEANLQRIWDRFFTTRADRGGTGLGLPIVMTVVEAHGGSVGVQSTTEEGTTFSFDLPVPR